MARIYMGPHKKPEKLFRHYSSRDNAMKAAKNYIATGKLTSRTTIPPEVTAVWEKASAQQATIDTYWAEYRALKDQSPDAKILHTNKPKPLEHWIF